MRPLWPDLTKSVYRLGLRIRSPTVKVWELVIETGGEWAPQVDQGEEYRPVQSPIAGIGEISRVPVRYQVGSAWNVFCQRNDVAFQAEVPQFFRQIRQGSGSGAPQTVDVLDCGHIVHAQQNTAVGYSRKKAPDGEESRQKFQSVFVCVGGGR